MNSMTTTTISLGSNIYYTGDQSNSDGVFTVTKLSDGYATITEINGNRVLAGILTGQIGHTYEGHCGTRFVTTEARDAWQAARNPKATSMNGEPSNETRAEWAREALETFGDQTGQSGYFDVTDPEKRESCIREIVGDFLADLHHLVRLEGLDFAELVAQGVEHHNYELAEETQAR
jgi:hypothetical protein